MDGVMIAQVRRFSRTVTERVGVLDDRFLGSGRPYGEARLLWEIGFSGRDVRSLRAELGLDSGYVSRLLRALETAGLVTVVATEADRRVRVARLTPEGVAERETLERRGDETAQALLRPLSVSQRDRLVAAMAEVELLLRAGTIEIADTDPADPDARRCLRAFFAELDERFEQGFDLEQSISAGDDELRPPAGVLVVARLGEEPVGCGAVKFRGDTGEIKRMWVSEKARGLGLGRRLLGELEARAVRSGARRTRLETNENLKEALALYRSAGYREVPSFNEETYAHHWFEKALDDHPTL